jgi:hypothetical protein
MEWDRKDEIWSARWQDCQVQHLNFWFRSFCTKKVRLFWNAPWLDPYMNMSIYRVINKRLQSPPSCSVSTWPRSCSFHLLRLSSSYASK